MRPVTHLHPVPDRQPSPSSRVQITDWQRLEVEGVRALLMDLHGRVADPGPAHTMAYLAGLLEGAAANLLDIIDAITEGERSDVL